MTPPFEFLGPYRIGDVIGRGGMGTVYSAVHERSKEKVAVKLIAANVADEPRFRRRFNAEIKSLELLNHVGIVRIIGYGEEDSQLFYSMELVEGESLQARIRREKRLEWRPTIDIAIQVCAALKHAHDMGVIHRDLKPANLLLTSEDVDNGKPHPEVYYLAASKHRIETKDMLVLEDSVQGTKAGVASGSLTVAVPGRHSVDCDYGHVDHVAESLNDNLIYELLDQ